MFLATVHTVGGNPILKYL